MKNPTGNDNATLIHLDTVLAAFLPTLAAMVGGALRGWADRLRAARHPKQPRSPGSPALAAEHWHWDGNRIAKVT